MDFDDDAAIVDGDDWILRKDGGEEVGRYCLRTNGLEERLEEFKWI